MFPSQLTLEAGRSHTAELAGGDRESSAATAGSGARRRRGLGEQLEALRRRLEIGRRRRGVLSALEMARYTGARV